MNVFDKIYRNFKAEFTARLVSIISGALLIVLIARLLDPHDYGVLYLSLSILGVGHVISRFGIPKSTARYISEYKEQDPSLIPSILKYGLILNLIVILATSILFIIIHDNIGNYFEADNIDQMMLIGVLFIVFGSLSTFVRVVLQGHELINKSASLLIVDRVLRVILVVGLILLGFGAIGALAGYILASFFVTCIGLYYVYVSWFQKVNIQPLTNNLRRRIIIYAIPITATSAGDLLDDKVDTILVGLLIGPVGVAYYTLGKQISRFVETPASALGFTVAPSYGSLKASNDLDKAQRLFENAAETLILIYIPASVGLILLAEPTILIIFGNDYRGAVPVLQILAIYTALQSMGHIIDNGLDFLGQAKYRALAKGLTGLLNAILNIMVIPIYGVAGAALVTVITTTIYRLFNGYVLYKEFNFRLISLMRWTLYTLLISFLMGGVVFFFRPLINGPTSLILTVLIGLLIWLFMSIISGMINIKYMIAKLT